MPPVLITDVAGKELSLIFEKFKGEAWSPVNGDARVITTKGQPRKTLIETIKGYFYPAADVTAVSNSWPVGEEVPDNIDGDGDGPEDYSAYALAITGAAYDINQAMYLSEPARSQAIVAVVDEFRKGAQAMFGSSEKAGRRHSDGDMKHLQAIKEHLDALMPAPPTETEDEKAMRIAAEESLKAFAVGDLSDDGLPANFADFAALCEKAKKKSDEPYGQVEYADPGYQKDGKKRYPVDTKEHAKAAWSYINKESNAEKYSADDLKKVKDKIKAACEKFGVEIGESKGSPLTPPTKNGVAAPSVDVTALIQKAVSDATAAFDAKLETAKSEVRSEAETRIAAVENAANQRVEKAESELTQTKAQLEQANASIKALVGEARTPTSGGFVATRNEDGSKTDPAKDAVKAEAQQALKGASTIAQVIQLQRIANS